ncbi:MAG: hypothetical protein ACRDPT_06250 [Streptomycetales bacterium]
MYAHRVAPSRAAVLAMPAVFTAFTAFTAFTVFTVGLAVTGCASGPAGSTQANTPRPAASTGPATGAKDESTPGAAAAKTIGVTIAEGEVSPAPDRVRLGLGQQVRIIVRSDRADEVHVHGYDAEAQVTPAKPVTLEFTADQPGLFDVETHESGQVLVQLEVSG